MSERGGGGNGGGVVFKVCLYICLVFSLYGLMVIGGCMLRLNLLWKVCHNIMCANGGESKLCM